MPYKRKICGIYQIETPNGSRYVGSSTNILGRWAEHRMHLRRGTHHSTRLQAAYDKHGDKLTFSVIEECDVSHINDREQFHITDRAAELNTTPFVSNVWANEDTRAKLMAVYDSPEWREARRKIASESKTRWVPVVCSDGREFKNTADAARAFGLRNSGMKRLAETQHLGKLGVRFRLASEPWREIPLRKSKEKPPSKNGGRVPVIGTCVHTGMVLSFPSQRDAGRFVHPSGSKRTSAQIVRACVGRRPTAYGFSWRYANAA